MRELVPEYGAKENDREMVTQISKWHNSPIPCVIYQEVHRVWRYQNAVVLSTECLVAIPRNIFCHQGISMFGVKRGLFRNTSWCNIITIISIPRIYYYSHMDGILNVLRHSVCHKTMLDGLMQSAVYPLLTPLLPATNFTIPEVTLSTNDKDLLLFQWFVSN